MVMIVYTTMIVLIQRDFNRFSWEAPWTSLNAPHVSYVGQDALPMKSEIIVLWHELAISMIISYLHCFKSDNKSI